MSRSSNAPERRRRVRRKDNPEGRMSLGEHFREFRNRTLISAVAILLCSVVGWMLYDRVFDLLMDPIRQVSDERDNPFVTLNFGGLTQPFSMRIKISLIIGTIIASPVWIYQIWAFLVPAMKKKEKRTALIFLCAAVPLFLGGCAFGVVVVPVTVKVLYGFTPDGAANLPDAGEYLSTVTQIVLAFGIAFLLPVLMLGLNTARVLPGRVMLKGWRIATVLIFIFAAIATADPSAWTMLALALPMEAFYFGSCGLAIWMDKRRAAKSRSEWADLPDDQASPL